MAVAVHPGADIALLVSTRLQPTRGQAERSVRLRSRPCLGGILVGCGTYGAL